MKKHNKFLSFVLAVIIIFSSLSFIGSAVSIDSGISELRKQWKRSKGPADGGYALEYSYFVPKNTSKKAPLFVFMAGAGEGSSAGKELTANNFANWSSGEYQSKVNNAKGAYLMILRAPEPVYFDTCPSAACYAAIDDFANKNNVDKNRIYVFGWCLGASGAAKLALKYPNYFAGIALISPRTKISSNEAKKLKNMAVWVLGCKNDTYSFYNMYTEPSWENIKAQSSNKNKVRFTSCTSAPRAAALLNHNLWRLAEYDYSGATGSYSSLSTIDGNNKKITNPEFINWFSKWSNSASSISEPQNSEVKTNFFQRILSLFKSIFSLIIT